MPTPLCTPPKLTSDSLAVAPCTMVLDAGPELQLLPAGIFRGRDGRPHDAPYWKVDAALAEPMIAAAAARRTPYVIDYEHQTLLVKDNGQPAPASGWYSRLEWRESGLFAVDVEWTAKAKAMIEAKEYRFISPVIGYNKATGAVTAIYMAALTNTPNIDGMNEVLSAAALHFLFSQPTPLTEDPTMNIEELLEQLRWLLNLPVGATADDVKAHLQKLIDQIKKDEPTATAAASFNLAAYLIKQRDQIAALSSGTPDPTKFVPIEAYQQLQTHTAQLSAQVNTGRVDEIVSAALASGKLVPAMEPWARALGNKDFAALSAFVEKAPAIVTPGATQTNGNPPEGSQGVAALTAEQVHLCRAMGVSEADYLKTLQAGQQT